MAADGSLSAADRILGKVDTSRLVKLTGSVNPRATPASDVGAVDPSMKLNYVRLMLKPSAAQQAELNQLLRDQQTPGSPNFRKWLTPEQFADRFGVSQADIAQDHRLDAVAGIRHHHGGPRPDVHRLQRHGAADSKRAGNRNSSLTG